MGTSPPSAAPTRIEADILIPGRGAPVVDGCVILRGGVIEYAGRRTAAPPTPDAEPSRVAAVLPGLWDCHCHLFGLREANLQHLASDEVALRATRIGPDVHRALMAGFTSLREVGGLGVHLARSIAEGTLPGPEIYAAGALLSTTGGHGDIHGLPETFVASCDRFHDLELCDGVPECLRAVRRQLRRGARVIKVCATGGVLSELDHPQHAQFSHEELVAIVSEAARAERVVAAHCHGKAGVMAAVRAGVRTIEHGTYLDAEAAQAMADTGTILVPTRFIGHALLAPDSSVEMPDFARRKLTETYRRGREGVAHAIAAGVTIAAGTDILTSGDHWGNNGRELALLVECGLSTAQAIEAATANGPLTVGPQAALTGQLVAGHVADVIAVSANPLDDVEVLADGSNVTHVWRAGVLAKSPGT
jgi:imidazolonepropionase-like amidohydrolase